jgi:hypothetical protein
LQATASKVAKSGENFQFRKNNNIKSGATPKEKAKKA